MGYAWGQWGSLGGPSGIQPAATMILVAISVAVLGVSAAPTPPGASGGASPPTMTPYQRQLVRQAGVRAAAASAAATPALLAALKDPRLRANLSACCPHEATLSAEALLARFEAELVAAEVVHGFEASPASPTQAGCDVDLRLLRNSTHLPNLWELIFDGQRSVKPLEVWGGGPADAAETGIFGYRFFSPAKPTAYKDIVLPLLAAQAAERPVYNAINFRRIALGIPMFGPIALVLRPSVVRPMAVLAPQDT